LKVYFLGLKVYFLITLSLKSNNQIFLLHLRNLWTTPSGSS
jgi:hypothetical protein